MTHEKGLDVFIRSLVHTPEYVRACIIGDGVERGAGERLAADLGVAHRISWAGLVNEAGRYFNAFDVLCQSSRTEGIPMVVLEAMAMHIPVVATAVGGVPDVLSGNEAILVPSEDSPVLGGAITDAVVNSAQARRRAGAAYDRLHKQFSGDDWMDEHERIYRLAMSDHRSRVD
jgi:glycosyltransferase involved in cell wall biosynthesis